MGEFLLHREFSIKVLSVYVLLSPYPLSIISSSPVFYSAMPRQRGIPRRGGKTGTRGESGRHGSSEPRCISPIAIASPSSLPSENSKPTLNSSLHTARFKFKSQLNKPLISAIVSVIFSEEEAEATSSDEMSKEQSPSHRSSDSQGSLVGAFLNVFASGHEEGQHKEFRPQLANEDIADNVYIEEIQQVKPQGPEEPHHPCHMTQEEVIVCAPAQWEEGALNLLTTLDGEPVFDEYGMVTWVAATNRTGVDKKEEWEQA